MICVSVVHISLLW